MAVIENKQCPKCLGRRVKLFGVVESIDPPIRNGVVKMQCLDCNYSKQICGFPFIAGGVHHVCMRPPASKVNGSNRCYAHLKKPPTDEHVRKETVRMLAQHKSPRAVQYLKGGLLERAKIIANDPDLLNMKRDAALISAVIEKLSMKIEGMPDHAQFASRFKKLNKAIPDKISGDPELLKEWKQLGEDIESAQCGESYLVKLPTMLKTLAEVKKMEIERILKAGEMVSPQEFIAAITVIHEIAMRHVKDDAARKEISDTLSALLRRDAA